MFYLTLADRFIPQPWATEASLRWALDTHGIELPEAAIEDIMIRSVPIPTSPTRCGS